MSIIRDKRVVRVRRVVRAVVDRRSGRKAGSMPMPTDRMLATNEALMMGATNREAGLVGGYSDAYGGAKRVKEHPTVIALNQAALAKAGVTLELLAQKVRDGLEAQRTICVSVIDEGGGIKGKELVKEDDQLARHKFLTTAVKMTGHELAVEKLQTDMQVRLVQNNTTVNVVMVPDEFKGLKGKELEAAYRERMRAIAAGETPEDIKVLPATTLGEAIDQSRAIAYGAVPLVPGATIMLDPVNGEVQEVVEVRPTQAVDRAQMARSAVRRYSKPLRKRLGNGHYVD